MKKLILISSLLAATTLAANAAVVSYGNLFDQASSWEIGNGRPGRGKFVISAGSASLANSNWSQSYASYTFTEVLELSSGEELNFKFDLNVQNLDGSFTLSLIGSNSDSGTIMIGKNYQNGMYGNKLVYAKTNDVSKKSYQLKENATDLMGKIDSATQVGSATFTANTKLTVSGTISKVGENYSLKLVSSDHTATVDLGTSFDLKSIGLYGDGANNTNNATFSNLSISIIPEPSMFGLLAGLGALALVAARRRRK